MKIRKADLVIPSAARDPLRYRIGGTTNEALRNFPALRSFEMTCRGWDGDRFGAGGERVIPVPRTLKTLSEYMDKETA